MSKSSTHQVQVLSFSQVKVGDEWHSEPVQVTEEAVQTFSKLSGDYNLLHGDEEYAKHSIFHRRIAHGHLTVSIASGFWSMLFSGKTLAMLETNYKLLAPVFLGDFIVTRVRVTNQKPASNYDGGVVTLSLQILARGATLVVEGSITLLLSN
jgi:3-hydroxybutyryl-CoA dehydratase